MSSERELFGSMSFNESVMKEYLTDKTYERLMKIRKEGSAMDPAIADEVAAAMKSWAIGKGATHYTHWFQPMTGITAEKHDAFLEPDKAGKPVLEFTGKALIKGEPDASSFPSGGIRATFEARGYTVWDPTSDAFIKEDTLCIPTAFCSYTGAVLDKKTPLLRSMEALNKQAIRILHLFGSDAKYVYTTVGCEQEYFLINKDDYAQRPDLILTGRTLFGNPTPKGQVLEDHYFGTIRPRVKAFMKDLDDELWKLGIYSKTEHNEVAPCQHEMAPIFTRSNVAADQNQLVMETMKKVANRHGFVCLLHEKPFEGINGSGKHNNWAISTDTGENLLNPGKHSASNTRFLLFLAAVVKAVDEYQDLLRISVATAGNDHRLGANEAPPAIVSMFVGDELMGTIDSLITGKEREETHEENLPTKVSTLPDIKKDNTDRNRTSPFAFTGNKFEFRMPGSAVNISCTNIMLNTAVADSLRLFADRLEKESGDLETNVRKLVGEELKKHKRILFNGNGYSDEWVEEAAKRGLLNLKSTPEAYAHYDDQKNLDLFAAHGIYTKDELEARKVIGLTEYTKIINIEAETMLQMADKEILPASLAFSGDLAASTQTKKELGVSTAVEEKLLQKLSEHNTALYENGAKMKEVLQDVPEGTQEAADYMYEKVVPLMEEERKEADALEALVGKEYWPYPDYTDLLFYV